MIQQPLRILLLSDGLPGHANQARGLVQWLSGRYPVQCQELDVTLRGKGIAKLMLPRILRCRHLASLTRCFYRCDALPDEKPDLIISAGGNTSFLNVALARLWGVPNIFLGSRRRLRSYDFSAHLTLEPTGQANNIVMELVPTLTDSERQIEAGSSLRRELGTVPDERLFMLALGGDGAGYKYDEKSAQQIVGLMKSLSQQEQCRWLLTSSRRTGQGFEDMLRQKIPQTLLADAVWWSQQPRKVMNAYMGAAEQIFVTADSMSMINEAIASGKPVTLLQPEQASPDDRYRQALQKFTSAGYCQQQLLNQSVIQSGDAASTPPVQAREMLLEQLIPIVCRIRPDLMEVSA